jgi:hypothetical protein
VSDNLCFKEDVDEEEDHVNGSKETSYFENRRR